MTEAAVFAAFPTLKTPRLVLRQIRPEDADAVYRLFADDEVTRYYDLDTFTDPAQARDLIERFQRRFDSQIGLRWGLALANAPADLIGTCGYNIWIRPARRGLLGYDLAPEHWGRGLMREALAAILAFGFSTMQLNRVEALTFPQNAASRQLLTKLGFKAEGLLREYEHFADGPQDMAIYGLLQREWSPTAEGLSV